MRVLVIGLVVFILIHTVPTLPSLKQGLVNKLGENGYKGVFSLISFVGLGLIIWGKSMAPFEPLWQTPLLPHSISYILVFVAFILFPAANMPTNIKRFTRHPMLWGVVLWSIAHLLANGDKASIVLFGSFLAYSLLAMVSSNARGATLSDQVHPLSKDLIVVAAGVFVYVIIFFFHGSLFGYPLGS